MPFSVTIQLVGLGLDTGPFNILSNSTGPFVAVETGVPKSALLAPAAYEVVVPDGTTVVRVLSTGTCDTYLDFPVSAPPSTTSTTTSSTTTSTTSTTTTIPPTTTTTTTV